MENKKNDEVILFFDEFSVTTKTSLFYGWGKKRQALKIPSQEGSYKKTNGLISIDATSGKEYVEMMPSSKADDVADYLSQVCTKIKNDGNNVVTIILDNNRTHKDKMRYNLWLALKSNELMIDFIVKYVYIAPYSPDYNLAEYAIHLLRVNVLHHCSPKLTLDDKETMVRNYLQNNHLFSKPGLENTLAHILNL